MTHFLGKTLFKLGEVWSNPGDVVLRSFITFNTSLVLIGLTNRMLLPILRESLKLLIEDIFSVLKTLLRWSAKLSIFSNYHFLPI